jgi:hypothetical protein
MYEKVARALVRSVEIEETADSSLRGPARSLESEREIEGAGLLRAE